MELRVSRKLEEDYVQPPKRFAAFEGSGQRLGSPLPAALSGPSTSSQQPPGAFPGTSSSSNATPAGDRPSITTKFEVDQSKPTTSIQIRLADGTRYMIFSQS